MNSSLKQLIKSPAFPGGIITILIFSLDHFQFELVDKFLLFAALVIVPLVILLLNHDAKNTYQRVIYAAMKWLQFPAALLTLASIMSSKIWGLESTTIPGILSLGWLLFTLLLGIYGLTTIVISKGKAAEVAIGAGLVYFLSGAFGLPYININWTSSKLIRQRTR